MDGIRTPTQQELFGRDHGGEMVIYRMTITLPNGKVIRRSNGQPFRIVIRSGKPKLKK
jgi:hypothetical protein